MSISKWQTEKYPYSRSSLLAPIELTGLYKNESIQTFPKKLNQIACEIHIQPGHYGATRLDPGTYPAGFSYGFALSGGGTPLSDRDSRRGSNGGNWLASASLSRQATTAGVSDKHPEDGLIAPILRMQYVPRLPPPATPIGGTTHSVHCTLRLPRSSRSPSPFLQFVLPQAPMMTAIYVRRLTSRSIIYPHKFTEEASLSRPDW